MATAAFAGLCLAVVLATAPAAAAPKRVIEPRKEDQGFPGLIQKVQKGRVSQFWATDYYIGVFPAVLILLAPASNVAILFQLTAVRTPPQKVSRIEA